MIEIARISSIFLFCLGIDGGGPALLDRTDGGRDRELVGLDPYFFSVGL